MLKLSANVLILIQFSYVTSKSLFSGIFPDDWKCARVIPLFIEAIAR